MIEGKEKGLFDAIRFKTVLEENERLKAQIEDLKFQLMTEKKYIINELYEDQRAIGKVTTLSQEVNLLGNIKVELMSQIQQLNIAHKLQVQSYQSRLEYVEKEKDLVYEKMVGLWI